MIVKGMQGNDNSTYVSQRSGGGAGGGGGMIKQELKNST